MSHLHNVPHTLFTSLPYRCRSIAAGAALLALSAPLHASPYETGGTGITTRYALESYVSWQDSAGGSRWVTPNVELKAPVNERLEVSAETNYRSVHDAGEDGHGGAGDSGIAGKWKLLGPAGAMQELDIKPALVAPTGDDGRGLGDGAWQLKLPLMASWNLDGYNLGAQVGFTRVFGEDADKLFLSGVVQVPLTATLRIGAELAGDTLADDTGAYHWRGNVGFKWKMTPDLELHGLFSRTIENRRGDALSRAKLVVEYKF